MPTTKLNSVRVSEMQLSRIISLDYFKAWNDRYCSSV